MKKRFALYALLGLLMAGAQLSAQVKLLPDGNGKIGFYSGGTETSFLHDDGSSLLLSSVNLVKLNAAHFYFNNNISIRNSGRIGLGTQAPYAPLHIVSGSDARLSDVSGYAVFGAIDGKNLVMDENEILARNDGATSPLLLQAEGGNLGVGLLNPEELFHVYGSVDPTLLVQSNGNSELSGKVAMRQYNDTGADMYYDGRIGYEGLSFDLLNANNSNPLTSLFIKNSTPNRGGVGIQTIDPLETLDVNGDIALSDGTGSINFYKDGSTNARFYHNGSALNLQTTASGDNIFISSAGYLTLNATNRFSLLVNNGSAVTVDLNRNALFHNAVDIEGTLNVDGQVEVGEKLIVNGADLAERFHINLPPNMVPASPQPGMVVSIDRDHPGELVLSDKAYDRTVAGVISGAKGIKTAMELGQAGTLADGDTPVVVSGRVYCLVDADYGAVEPGDLLTTSGTFGHAMKVSDYDTARGAIIGKAMTGLTNGKGMVLILLSLQ